jgi:uncharacterized phage protein (TIGR01671 family)
MQREIKFRGKRVDNGEWVHGNYFIDERDIEDGFIWREIPQIQQRYGDHYQYFDIINDTIGQYTGLKDKNGKEIYEGDICNCREYECFGKIEWNEDNAGFYFYVVVEGGGFDEECLYEYADELEVIGNIYDNPELLEVSHG